MRFLPWASVLFVLTLSACKTLPDTQGMLSGIPFMKSSEQEAGEAAMASGDYDEAVRQLTQAATRDPNDEEIQTLLARAREAGARQHFSRGLEAEEGNDPRRAAAEFQQALSLQETPDHRFRAEQAKARMQQLSEEVRRAIAALSQAGDWDSAIRDAERLAIYKTSFPELAPALESGRRQAGRHFSQNAEDLIEQRRFLEAHESAIKAADLSGEESYRDSVDATTDLQSAREKTRQRDFSGAVMRIDEALSKQPGNRAIATYRREVLEQASGQLFNDALRASAGGRYLEAIQKFTEVQNLNPDLPGVDQQLLRNRKLLAQENRMTAESLARQGEPEVSGRVLLHYLLASHFDPSDYTLESAIQQARKGMERAIEQRVSIQFTNKSRELGAGDYVRDRVLDGLRQSSARNLSVLERENLDQILQEQGLGQGFLDETTAPEVKKIRGVQTQVAGVVQSVDIRETGQDRPSYDSVRYISGTRLVPNPDYRRYQAEVNSAQDDVYRAQQSLNRAREERQNATATYDPNQGAVQNQLSLLGQVVADGEVSSAESDLRRSQDRLADARYRLTNEPPQIEEPVYAQARFPIYNLRLDGEVRISFRLIDTTTSAIGQTHNIEIKDSVEDRYVPGDPGKGIADDPRELPPENVFRLLLLDKAVAETITRLNGEFARHADGYLLRAQRAKERGVIDEAAEYYMRYLSATASNNDDSALEARQFLFEQYGAEVAP